MLRREEIPFWIIVALVVLVLGMLAGISAQDKKIAVLEAKVSWYEKHYEPIEPGFVPTNK